MFVNTYKGKRKAIFVLNIYHEIHYLLPQGSAYPSTSSPSESEKEEAQKWLKTAIEESVSRLGLQWREDEASRDMLEFVGFAQQAVYRGMERELAIAEKRHPHGQAHVRIADFCEQYHY